MQRPFALTATLASLACLSSVVSAQIIVDTTYDVPTGDRWNYPFNFTPGTRFTALSFGAIDIPGFDDHDGQFVVGFDTTDLIPPGLGSSSYRIESVRLRASIADGGIFEYDPTLDPLGTYLASDDPDFVPDADIGRPIELYGVGYRGTFSDGTPVRIDTWTETSEYGDSPVVAPAQGNRFAFASVLDDSGQPVNLSNRLKDRLAPAPFAIGTTASVAPGDLVPADTTFEFDIERCNSGADLYLRESLDSGVVRFTIASLQPAVDPTGGPSNPNYPIWYTKENPLAIPGFAAQLEIRVRIVSNPADLSSPTDPGVPDGVLTGADFFEFLSRFQAGDLSVDFAGPTTPNQPDCVLTGADFFAFLNLFSQG